MFLCYFSCFLRNIQNMQSCLLKFIYSEKATKFCKIFTFFLTVCTVVLRIYEFYMNKTCTVKIVQGCLLQWTQVPLPENVVDFGLTTLETETVLHFKVIQSRIRNHIGLQPGSNLMILLLKSFMSTRGADSCYCIKRDAFRVTSSILL